MKHGVDKRDRKSAPAADARTVQDFPAPPAIPDHTLIRRIGSGSYGEVWLARNSMGEFRAVKIVYRSCFDDQRPFERELSGMRKFEPISRSHEGFVDILHVGLNDSDGYFFYIMELGDDCVCGREIHPENYSPKTLASHISAQGGLPVQECLELGSALAKASHQLHLRGLVHRDIKPSNIIFIDGVARLADIGLVTGVDETRSYVGTEGFIPPEGPGNPQADVFSLGRVLYEASTGKDRHYFPELPDSLKDFPDPQRFLELNEIILRACRTDPCERYKSAAEMQADFVVLLEGKSVKRLRQLERILSTAKRAAVALLIALAVGTLITYPVYHQYQAKVDARQRQIGSAIAYGNRSLESGDLLGSLAFFADALRLHHEGHGDEAVDRMRLGLILAQCPKLVHLWSEDGKINDGEFSPDGKRVVFGFANGYAKVYELGTGSSSRVFAQSEIINTTAFSHDGQLIATASDDCTACIIDAATLTNVATIIHPDRVKSARFSPDDLQLITACRDGVARIWNGQTGAFEFSISHGGRLRFADFSHDGRLIATAGEDGTGRIWDAKTGQPLAILHHPHWVTCISFSPDDSEVVTACSDHKARLWGIDGQERYPALTHEDGVFNAEFSPDGRWLLTACLDGTARLWRKDTLQPVDLNPILPSGQRVRHAAFSPDARCIVTTGVTGGVRILDLSGGSSPPAAISCVASADGTRLATLNNGTLVVKDAATENRVGVAIRIGRSDWRMKLNTNGRYALISLHSQSSADQTLRILNLSSGRPLGEDFHFQPPDRQFLLSDDGRILAVFAGNVVHLVATESHRVLSQALAARDPVNSARFDPSGQHLVTWGGTVVQVWNVTNGETCFPPLEFSNLVSTVSLRGDGRQLIGSCWDDQLTSCYSQVWDFKTGKTIGPKLMQGDGVLCSCFSPDGSRIGTASEDYTAVVWNSKDGAPLTVPMRHHDRVESIAFSPDGRWTVTASDDHTARIWSADTGDPLSPPLRDFLELRSAQFLSGATRVRTVAMNGSSRIWELGPDERPVADILNHANLLSGSPVSRFAKFASDQSESVEAVWQRLRKNYPSLFSTSEVEARKWHEFAAEESETNGDWYSAAFHLKYLQASSPTDGKIRARLDSANERLQRAK
jgi:WD40 repeat protein